MSHEEDRRVINLPVRPFLYSMPQVAGILSITIHHLQMNIAYYDGRSIHRQTPHDMKFINIAKEDKRPVWRVAEQELIRWMKIKGFCVHDASWARRN